MTEVDLPRDEEGAAQLTVETLSDEPRSRLDRLRRPRVLVAAALLLLVGAGILAVITQDEGEHDLQVASDQAPATGDEPTTTVGSTTTSLSPTTSLVNVTSLKKAVTATAPVVPPPTTSPPTTKICGGTGPVLEGGGLWLVPAAGGEPRRLMYERAQRVTWSPDGRHVVAGASFGGSPKVAIFDAVSWARHDLAGAARSIFAWAPDSKRLLYVAEREQYTDTLYAIDAAGGAPSVVYESMFQINDVAVGANGMIAVAEGAYLGVMASDGSGYRRLAEGVFQSVVMAPAGTKVATVSQDSLLIVDVASGTTTKVAPSQSPGFPYGWSKSGDHVAYNQVDGDGQPHAVVARADGSALRTIMDFPLALSFSHDSRQVAASDGRTMGEPKTHDLVVVDLASGASNVVLQQAGSLSWSPAGSLIATAVLNVSGGREGVCLVSGDGSNVRRLVDFAEGTAPLGSPTWSPTGNQLLVATL